MKPKHAASIETVPFTGFSNLVEQHYHDDVGRDREEVACKPQLIQGLVRDDIRRCHRGVTTDEDPAAREAGEPRYHDIQQIEETRHSRGETRRHTCDRSHGTPFA